MRKENLFMGLAQKIGLLTIFLSLLLSNNCPSMAEEKEVWTESIKNWKGDNLTLDTDAKVGKHSLRITPEKDQFRNFLFTLTFPEPQDLSSYIECSVWAKRKGEAKSSWLRLYLVDINGKRWYKMRSYPKLINTWQSYQYELSRDVSAYMSGVDEGFDFSKIKKIKFESGAWWDKEANIWIDGLHFEGF